MPTIVVARYREDVSWTSNFADVVIYDKSASGDTPNVGRETHTYLLHIVKQYEHMKSTPSDVTFFTQGNIHSEGENPRRYISASIENATVSGFSHVHCKVYDDPLVHAPRHCFRICEWPPGSRVTPNRRDICFGDWFETVLRQRFPIKTSIRWVRGACFAVRHDIICAKPRTFFETLLSEVSHDPNPEEGHFFERSWMYVFAQRPEYVTRLTPFVRPSRQLRVCVAQFDDRFSHTLHSPDLVYDDDCTIGTNDICVNFIKSNSAALRKVLSLVNASACTLSPDAVPYPALTSAINRLKCMQAGMSYYCGSIPVCGRASSWMKIRATMTRSLGPNWDVVVMLDSDAWIKDAPALMHWLEYFWVEKKSAYGLFVDETSGKTSFDDQGQKMLVNGGFLVFKNDDRAVKFAADVWRVGETHRQYLSHWPYEQMCIHKRILADNMAFESFLLAPMNVFNTPAGCIVRHDWTKKFILPLGTLDLIQAAIDSTSARIPASEDERRP